MTQVLYNSYTIAITSGVECEQQMMLVYCMINYRVLAGLLTMHTL